MTLSVKLPTLTPCRCLPRPSTSSLSCLVTPAIDISTQITDVSPVPRPRFGCPVGGALDALQTGPRNSPIQAEVINTSTRVEEPSVAFNLRQSHIRRKRCRVHRRVDGVILRARYVRFVCKRSGGQGGQVKIATKC
jgi:hypothetical protein